VEPQDPATTKRLRAFLNFEPMDRPALALFLGLFMPDVFPNLCARLPRGAIAPDDIQVEPFLEDIELLCEKYSQLGDDVPYAVAPFIYMPWMEAIVGCPIFASENSIWAEPAIRDWDDWEWKALDLAHNQWARKLLELTDALVKHSAGRYPVGQTLMRGVSDVLCAMRGAASFTLDFIDHPEIMQRSVAFCADAFVQVAKAQLRLIPSSENGYVSSGAHRAWAPAPMVWLQEDALGLMSPRLFRDFILPQDRRILQEFRHTGFHLHGTVPWAVEAFAAMPELGVLNFCFESLQPNVEATFAGFRRIQELHKPLAAWKEFDGDCFWPWLERFLGELSPQGLLLEVTVHDLDEGHAVRESFGRLG